MEPWFHHEGWIDGLVMAESATTEDLAITRLSHSTRDGDISHFDFYWTVGRGPTLHGRSEAGGPTHASSRRQHGGTLDRTPHLRVVVR